MANVRKVALDTGGFSWRATIQTLEGKRKSKNFPRKGDADAWVRENDGASANGSATMTMLELARDHNRWFDVLVSSGVRAMITSDGYDSDLRIHLLPYPLAKATLNAVDPPMIQRFLDGLVERGSINIARTVKKSLSAWCGHAVRNGWMKINPVTEAKVVQKKRRRKADLIYIPPKSDLVALLAAAREGPMPERDSAIAHLLMFCGPRISELLGMADDSVTLQRPGANHKASGSISIHERLCSRHVTLGEVKSDDGLREVPLGPATAAAVRAWRVARGPSGAGRVNGAHVTGRLLPGPVAGRFGPFWSYSDWRRQCWEPLMLRAGLAERIRTGKHDRIKLAFGPHTLRHVFASIQIENKVTPKKLQQLMGHATLAMTMDLYGHLWADPEGDQAMAEAGELAITAKP